MDERRSSASVRWPETLHDALANLCQLFGATVGEDDVKLFKFHVKENDSSEDPDLAKLKFTGMIIEIEVSDQVISTGRTKISRIRKYGAESAEDAWKLYNKYKGEKEARKPGQVFMIPDDLSDDDIRKAGVPLSLRRIRQAKAAGKDITEDEQARLSHP